MKSKNGGNSGNGVQYQPLENKKEKESDLPIVRAKHSQYVKAIGFFATGGYSLPNVALYAKPLFDLPLRITNTDADYIISSTLAAATPLLIRTFIRYYDPNLTTLEESSACLHDQEQDCNPAHETKSTDPLMKQPDSTLIDINSSTISPASDSKTVDSNSSGCWSKFLFYGASAYKTAAVDVALGILINDLLQESGVAAMPALYAASGAALVLLLPNWYSQSASLSQRESEYSNAAHCLANPGFIAGVSAFSNTILTISSIDSFLKTVSQNYLSTYLSSSWMLRAPNYLAGAICSVTPNYIEGRKLIDRHLERDTNDAQNPAVSRLKVPAAIYKSLSQMVSLYMLLEPYLPNDPQIKLGLLILGLALLLPGMGITQYSFFSGATTRKQVPLSVDHQPIASPLRANI